MQRLVSFARDNSRWILAFAFFFAWTLIRYVDVAELRRGVQGSKDRDAALMRTVNELRLRLYVDEQKQERFREQQIRDSERIEELQRSRR